MSRSLQVEDGGLRVEPGLEPGSPSSQPWDPIAVPLEGPRCLPVLGSITAEIQGNAGGTFHCACQRALFRPSFLPCSPTGS